MSTQRFSSKGMVLLSGLISALTLPTVLFGYQLPNLSFLAWLSFVPLFLALRDVGCKRACALGFLWGTAYFAVALYWFYHAMHVFGGFGFLLSSVMTALAVFVLALFPASASGLAVWLARRLQLSSLWLLVPCWVLFEALREVIPFGGFSWAHIALSQWQNLSVLQSAEFLGVSGLIALILFVNACIAASLLAWNTEQRQRALGFLSLAGAVFAVIWIFGVNRLHFIEAKEQQASRITVGLVQANISQDEKWNGRLSREHLREHQKLTAQLAEHNTDLIIWPETSFPHTFPDDAGEISPALLGLQSSQSSAVLFGVITEKGENIRNSALLYNAQGQPLGGYHKIHLVPFGEYVPLQSLLSFAKKLTEPIGLFSAGTSTAPLMFGNIRIAPLICFEDTFVEPARAQALQGADIFANLTNDAWYGNTSAAYQHLGLSVFRSVENRRSLVRAANTGISAFVAPSGRVITAAPLFTQAVLAQPVPLLDLKTFHQRFPQLVSFACLFSLVVAAVCSFLRRSRGH